MKHTGQAGREPWRAHINPDAGNDIAIMSALTPWGAEGLTTEEVVILTDRKRTSASAHIRNLVKRGLVKVADAPGELRNKNGIPPFKYRVASAAEIAAFATAAAQLGVRL